MFDVQFSLDHVFSVIRCSNRPDFNTSTAAGLTPETSSRILYHVVRGTIQPINLINYSTALSDLTQKFQTARLFSQVIAYEFF